jgi:hypothetical protein
MRGSQRGLTFGVDRTRARGGACHRRITAMRRSGGAVAGAYRPRLPDGGGAGAGTT